MKTLITVQTLLLTCICGMANAANWSETEFHLQNGDLKQPFGEIPNNELNALIFTLQHSSGWEYGGNFFFIDHIQLDGNTEFYGEWYPTLSAKAVFGMDFPSGINDISFVAGFNAAPDANVIKYLPGIQISWDIPGFSFFNTMVTAYIDDSRGIASSGAPKEGSSTHVDVAWRYPLTVSNQSFSIEGHAEYISSRSSEIPNVEVNDWVLAQVQLRWDGGAALGLAKETLFLGVEYQYWHNKLGTDVNESTAQLLAVWRF